jgi:hypothetical protein
MSHHAPGGSGVLGAHAAFGGGGPAVHATGGVEGAVLPFTGSFFTLPIAVLGLVLTALGWLLRRLGAEGG